MTLIKTAIIVAIDEKNGISKNNKIPWKIVEDSNYFHDVTTAEYITNKKNTLIVGKTTFLSLITTENKCILKNRNIIVISRSLTNSDFNIYQMTNPEILLFLSNSFTDGHKLALTLDSGKIFICGGSEIYKASLQCNIIDEMYINYIKYDYNCDNFFPYNDIYPLIIPSDGPPDECGDCIYGRPLNKSFWVRDEYTQTRVSINFVKYSKSELNLYCNESEQNYLNLLEHIIKHGHYRKTRNANTWSTFGNSLEFHLEDGFPLLTTKKVFFKGIFEELMFFVKGDTNANHLSEKSVKIWEPNTRRQFLDSVGLSNYEEGDMGPMYGFNWRHFGAQYTGMQTDYTSQGFDQIKYCLELLKADPFSRRIMLTTFNPANAQESVLYPCHSIVYQFYVSEENNKYKLNGICYNRSQDTMLGTPFNIASSSLLLLLFIEVINNDTNYRGPKFSAGKIIFYLGDTHVYEEHYSQVIRQILRNPLKFPQIKFNRQINDICDFKFEDITIDNYKCYPTINCKMVA